MKKKVLPIIKNDPWLEPFADAINGRHEDVIRKQTELVGESGSLSDFANAHNYFGLHRTADGWVFREWAPNATAINMVGTFNALTMNFDVIPFGKCSKCPTCGKQDD